MRRVDDPGGHQVVILGYLDEPYVRIGPDGVEENVRSVSSYLNSSFTINQLPTANPSIAQQQPEWVHRTDQPSWRYHDHRVHWMGASRPPLIARDPTRRQRVLDWTMSLTVDGQPMQVTGTLDWLGAPGWPKTPLLAALIAGWILSVAVMGFGWLQYRRSAMRQRLVGLSPPEPRP